MVDGFGLAALVGVVAAAFIADVAAFGLMRRLQPEARRGRAHAAGLLVALLAVMAVPLLQVDPQSVLLVPALAMAVCNAYILFHLDNMAETARRVRILRELHEAGGSLERREIVLAYPPQEVFERRIARLTLAGQCHSRDGRLVLVGASYSTMQRVVDIFARLIFGRCRPKK